MEHQKRKLIAMLFLLSIAGAFNIPGQSDGNQGEINVKDISQYKSWLKVTPAPHRVRFTLATMDGLDS